MINKKLKTLSKFLRKEKVSVVVGVVFGIILTVDSQPNNVGTSRDVISAQAMEQSTEKIIASVTPLNRSISRLSNYGVLDEKETTIVNNIEEPTTSNIEEPTTSILEDTPTKEIKETEKVEQNSLKSGVFDITAYCPCQKCCGKWSYEVTGKTPMTATGTIPKQGRTIAVDPNVIPYGSSVYINGNEYIAEDCGGAIKGNRIDMYFESHEQALNWGRGYYDVSYSVAK